MSPMVQETTRALNGWHPGERAVQDLMRLPQLVAVDAVVKPLPEQHRIFHSTRLYFLPVTTLDEQGRPWASILTSPKGPTRYISSPSASTLEIHAQVWEGDPIVHNIRVKPDGSVGPCLISGVGVEPSTRRRNKFAGSVVDVTLQDRSLHLTVDVTEALGQCPKYINARTFEICSVTSPSISWDRLTMGADDRLPDTIIAFIHGADTAYLATSYVAAAGDRDVFPSHLGTSHRAGRPGFVRVRPSDGRTLVLPNYSGNRLMNSLGNIFSTPLAGLVFPSFTGGSVLYITGTARTLFGADAQTLMPGCNVVTTIRATGCVFVANALPLRQTAGTEVERSPYSPPVRYLAEEGQHAIAADGVALRLASATVHNDSLATFTFSLPSDMKVQPAQSGVFDLSEFVRKQARHLVDWKDDPRRENDDCVRTWTISTPPSSASPKTLSITIREIKTGLVTTSLLKLARKALGIQSTGEVDLLPLGVTCTLRSLGGGSWDSTPVPACTGGRRLLWVAGGIGITPFLSMAGAVAQLASHHIGLWDIVFVSSTREAGVTLNLISKALSPLCSQTSPTCLSLAVHIFCHIAPTSRPLPPWIKLRLHTGRIHESKQFFQEVGSKERECNICGPLPFIQATMAGLEGAGVDPEEVQRERFTY